jgi:hypothetical protein
MTAKLALWVMGLHRSGTFTAYHSTREGTTNVNYQPDTCKYDHSKSLPKPKFGQTPVPMQFLRTALLPKSAHRTITTYLTGRWQGGVVDRHRPKPPAPPGTNLDPRTPGHQPTTGRNLSHALAWPTQEVTDTK